MYSILIYYRGILADCVTAIISRRSLVFYYHPLDVKLLHIIFALPVSRILGGYRDVVAVAIIVQLSLSADVN